MLYKFRLKKWLCNCCSFLGMALEKMYCIICCFYKLKSMPLKYTGSYRTMFNLGVKQNVKGGYKNRGIHRKSRKFVNIDKQV